MAHAIEILFPVQDKIRGSGRGEFDHAVTVRGRWYQIRHVRQCDTCTSRYRSQIERAVMRGVTYADAARSVPGGDPRPSSRSVRQHFRRGHSPWLSVRLDERGTARRRSPSGATTDPDSPSRGVASYSEWVGLSQVANG